MDQPSVIIGGGRLGRALAEWGKEAKGADVVLGRGEVATAMPDQIVGGCCVWVILGGWVAGCWC